MADLVSLVCPTCGGKLEVSKNAVSLTCQHCGNEHMVKHESGGAIMLEAYARCPICGRNDKAEKVSAIIVSQSHEISGFEQRSEEVTNAQGQKQIVVREVPFTRKQVSVLGQRLAAPPPPDPSQFPPYPPEPKQPGRSGGITAIVFGALGLVLSLACAIVAVTYFFASSESFASSVVTTGLVMFGGGLMIFLVGGGLVALGIFLTIRANKEKPAFLAHYQEQVEAIRREHERIQGGYAQALDRWKRLYYCTRDDCVFIPGELTSAPLAKMNEYLVSTALSKN